MEVEIKAKVDNLEEIKKGLEKLGATFSSVKKENDYVYQLTEMINTFEPGNFILRVRESEAKNLLTFKALTDRYGVWDEHEVEIDKPEVMKRILEKSRFVLAYTVIKERISGKLKEFYFNLDKVKDLGDYIEVELISENGELAQEKIKGFLLELGIKPEQFERKGYPEIIAAKKGFHSKGQK